LRDVIDRVRPCWDSDLVPLLRAGRLAPRGGRYLDARSAHAAAVQITRDGGT